VGDGLPAVPMCPVNHARFGPAAIAPCNDDNGCTVSMAPQERLCCERDGSGYGVVEGQPRWGSDAVLTRKEDVYRFVQAIIGIIGL